MSAFMNKVWRFITEPSEKTKKVSLKRLSDADIKKMNESDQFFLKYIERENIARAEEMIVYRRNIRRMAIGLAIFSLSIYIYTLRSMKQEKYLVGFDEVPEEKKV